MKLSIVTTLYRSASYLEEFHRRICAAALSITHDFEIILVNDGSPDDCLEIAQRVFAADERVVIVDLSRNFGHHKAIMTGLQHARGEEIFLIDCDLEEPPELVSEFKAERDATGADVVYGVQKDRKGGAFERISGAAFYKLFNFLSSQPIPENLLTVRLMTRQYVEALLEHREREMLLAGLFAATGFEQVALPVQKSDKGSSSYSLPLRIDAFVNAITSFSNKPLVMVFYMGIAIMGLSILASTYYALRKIMWGIDVDGWTSLMLSIWFLGGTAILSIGVVGIYLSKVFIEVKTRPYTIVREVYRHGTQENGGE
jgi:putative glycosyltransferase